MHSRACHSDGRISAKSRDAIALLPADAIHDKVSQSSRVEAATGWQIGGRPTWQPTPIGRFTVINRAGTSGPVRDRSRAHYFCVVCFLSFVVRLISRLFITAICYFGVMDASSSGSCSSSIAPWNGNESNLSKLREREKKSDGIELQENGGGESAGEILKYIGDMFESPGYQSYLLTCYHPDLVNCCSVCRLEGDLSSRFLFRIQGLLRSLKNRSLIRKFHICNRSFICGKLCESPSEYSHWKSKDELSCHWNRRKNSLISSYNSTSVKSPLGRLCNPL